MPEKGGILRQGTGWNVLLKWKIDKRRKLIKKSLRCSFPVFVTPVLRKRGSVGAGLYKMYDLFCILRDALI